MNRSISNITWRLPRYKKEWKTICAMLPAYLPDGCNGTIVYYIDGTIEQVKGRLMLSRNDGQMGYVVLEYVQAIQRIYSDGSLGRTGSKRVERMRVQQRIVEQNKAEKEQDGKTMVYLSRNWEIAVYDSVRTLHQNLNLGAALKYRFGQES